jgi:hypothetical protein
LGRLIFARQPSQLGFEILETEIDVQTRGVLTEQGAHMVEVSRKLGWAYFDHGEFESLYRPAKKKPAGSASCGAPSAGR